MSSDEKIDTRVDFYVLDDASAHGRLKLACKLAEKAFLASQTVLIWHTEPDELRTLDDLLWTFRDGSFVPHDVLTAPAPGSGPASEQACESGPCADAPILLSPGIVPPGPVDVLINLAPDVPPLVARSKRVIEIIDADETRRKAGRVRFKTYRDQGIQPGTHNVRGE